MGGITVLIVYEIGVCPAFLSTKGGAAPTRIVPSYIRMVATVFHLVHYKTMVCDE
jgi:hypothetical protein